MIDVSIIIPTFNRLWSLPKAIYSCFETKLNVEVIVINDGSSDGSFEWLNEQTNIRVFHQNNLGKDWAINNFFEQANGKYIRFLDSDDWLLPFSSDMLFAEAECKNVDLVAAGHEVYSEEDALIHTIDWINCDDFVAQQLGECDSSHYSAYLFSKEFIKAIPHRQEYGAKDDRKFIIEVALKNPKISYIEKPTLAHRAHQQDRLQKNIGFSTTLNNIGSLKIYKSTLIELEKRGALTQRRKNASINILWPLAHWVAKDNIEEGNRIYEWIKILNPRFVIPTKGTLGFLYRNFGFRFTEKILKLRRIIFNGIN